MILDHCIEVLQKTAVPRHIVKRLPLTIENHTITIGDMVIHSKNLENNLKGCHAVYLFAATMVFATMITTLLKPAKKKEL